GLADGHHSLGVHGRREFGEHLGGGDVPADPGSFRLRDEFGMRLGGPLGDEEFDDGACTIQRLPDGLRAFDEELARESAVTALEQFGGVLDPLRIRRGDDVWKFHGTRVLDPYQLEYEVERWPPIGVRVADRCQSRRSASYAPNRLNGPEPEVRGRWQSPR